MCGVIVHHLMVQVNSDIDTYLCHCHSHCVMVRSDIVIDRDINLASVRATSWDAVLPSSSFLHSHVSRPRPNHRLDTPPFKCHLSCQLVSEMKGMTFLLSKRFYSNSSCDIIVQCLWPNDMQQFYHTIFWDLLHLSLLVLALEVLVVDRGLLVLLVLAHLDSYI